MTLFRYLSGSHLSGLRGTRPGPNGLKGHREIVMQLFLGFRVIAKLLGPAAGLIFSANRPTSRRPEEPTARIQAFDFNTVQPKGLPGSNASILECFQLLPNPSVKVPAIPPANRKPGSYLDRRAHEQSVANIDTGHVLHPDTGH